MVRLQLTPQTLDPPLAVATPLGDHTLLHLVCMECTVSLDDIQLKADLIVLHKSEFDVILGMDWLASYHVSLDCYAKTVYFREPGRPDLVEATSKGNPFAEAFLAHIEDVLQPGQTPTVA